MEPEPGSADSMGSGSGTSPGTAVPPGEATLVPRRRRWRRRLAGAVGILLLALAGLGAFRHSVLSAVLPRVLPAMLADRLGIPVAIEEALVRGGEGGTVIVELRRVALGEAALDRAGARPKDPAADPPLRSATVDRLRIRLGGWLAWRDGLAGVREVEVGELDLVLPDDGAPSDARPRVTRVVPTFDPVLPEEWPALPFPVLVSRFSIAKGEGSLEGFLRSLDEEGDPEGLHVRCDRVVGIPGVESGSVTWSPGTPGGPRLSVVLEPDHLIAEGRLERVDRHWILRTTVLNSQYFIGRKVEARIPWVDGEEASLVVELEGTGVHRIAGLLDRPELEVIPDPDEIRLELTGRGGDWRADGFVRTLVGDVTIEASLGDAEGTRAALVELASGDLEVGTILDPWLRKWRPMAQGSAQLWLEWAGGSPTLGGSFDLTDGSAEVGTARPFGFRRWTALGTWTPGGPIELETSVLDLPQGLVTMAGAVPLASDHEWSSEVVVHELQLEGIASFLGLVGVRDLRGRLAANGTIEGPALDPRASVRGRLENGEFAPAGWERFRRIDTDLFWDGEVLRAERLSAVVGGGTLQGDVTIAYDDGGELNFDSSVEFRAIRLIRQPNLRARGSGTLYFSGTSEWAAIAGEVKIVRGIYDQDLYPSLTGGGSSLPFDLFRLEDPFLSQIEFDVSLDLAGEFQVRNNRVRVAPFGVLHLGGTGYQPVLTGSIRASEGQLILPRITFDVTQVEVKFPVDDPFRPRVEFSGQGTVRDVEIDAFASGDLFAPTVTFSSSPSYPQDDLILLVATGRFRNQIAANEVGIVAATELAQIYGPQVWGSIFGGSGGESIFDRVELGAKLEEETGELDTVSVEVKLKKWLSVYAEQDGDGETTADLRFFWWMP